MVDLKKQVAFEKHEAQRCNCDYEDLKRHLDKVEALSGHRYTPTSPRSESWIVWSAAWDARQAEINELKAKLEAAQVHEGFVLVPKEPTEEIINAMHDSFLGAFIEGKATGGQSIEFAYKAMIEAQELTNE